MGTTAFSVSIATPAAANGAAYAQLVAPPTVKVAAIAEISAVLVAATASSIGLIVAATAGTQSTQVGGIEESNLSATANNGFAKLVSAWSVAPTLPGTPIYLRRVALPAVAGASISWTWSERNPLILPAASSLLIWNFGAGAGSILNLTVRWWEQQRISGPQVVYPNNHT